MPTGVYERTEAIILAIRQARNRPEVQEKIRKALTGKKLSDSHIESLRRSHLGKKLSEEAKIKVGNASRGEKNGNWRGGKSRGYKTGYYSAEYKRWRKAVFERDGYLCQHCKTKAPDNYVTAHHIKSFAQFPELRFNVDNGLTLCEECHKKTDNYAGRGRRK